MRTLLSLLAACAPLLAEAPPLASDLGLNDYPGILHCHSHFSHDSKGTAEEIVAAAKKTGIRFIFMTDHPSPGSVTEALRGMHGDTWFFAGAETHQLLACDLTEPVEDAKGTQGAIDAVLMQGGLAFICHPEEVQDWSLESFTGMEIYNLHADIKAETPATLLPKVVGFKGDPEWLYTVFFKTPVDNLKRWDSLTAKRRVVGVGGDDAHQNQKVLGVQLDPYARTFHFLQTHVFAERLDHDPICDHLSQGNAYVSFGLFGDPAGFSFSARCGKRTLLLGDEARWKKGATLRVKLPREADVRIVRNGEAWQARQTDDWTFEADGPGVYRVECWTHEKGKDWPWIYSNPIYLRE